MDQSLTVQAAFVYLVPPHRHDRFHRRYPVLPQASARPLPIHHFGQESPMSDPVRRMARTSGLGTLGKTGYSYPITAKAVPLPTL